MNIKISIVIVSYNQDRFLETTIRSVIEQSYKNKEVILIDGGSSDKSIEIIKKYSNDFAFWVSEPDKGQTDAIIKGFNKSTGDIIGWINSDDLLEVGVLETIVNKAQEMNTVDTVFYGQCLIIDSKGNKQDISVHEKFNYYISRKLGPCISQPGTFWGRKAYYNIGGLDRKLHYGMDLDLFNNFLFSGYRFYYTGKVHARFRRYPEQKGHSKEFLEKCVNETRFIEQKYGLDSVWPVSKKMDRIVQIFSRFMGGYYLKTFIFRYRVRRSFSEFTSGYTE